MADKRSRSGSRGGGRERRRETEPDAGRGGEEIEKLLDPELLKVLETLSEDEVKALPETRDDPELGPRRGTPLKPASIHFLVMGLRKDVHAGGIAQALAWEYQGTILRFLYARKADVVLQYPDFKSFTQAVCGISVATAKRRMRFARHVTRDEAQFYGYELCDVGITLKKLEKVERIADLDGREFAVPEAAGGGAETFSRHANVARLEAAAGLLEKRGEPQPVDEELESVAERMRGVVDEEVANDEALQPAATKVTVYDGRIRVSSKPVSGRRTLAALARLYARLSRTRGL